MTEHYLEGLAAALQFDCNLLQAFCLITIVRPWFTKEVHNDFLMVLEHMMDFFYAPIRKITRLFSTEVDIAPYVFLALLIPLQFVIMVELKGI